MQNIFEKKLLKNIDRVTCYSAEQSGFKREVLLYRFTLFYSDPSDVIPECENEIKKWAKLEHSTIIPIIDITIEEKEIKFATRKPEGNSVDSAKGDISTIQTWSIARSLASGLLALHQAGIFLGGIKETHLFYESEKWIRFSPDVLGERLNRQVEIKKLNINVANREKEEAIKDISTWGCFIACLLMGDQSFVPLKKINLSNQKSQLDLEIAGRNPEVTKSQEEFLKSVIFSATSQDKKFTNFEQIIDTLNKEILS